MQCVYEGLDAGDVVISIFLDFSKAFDSVDHKILLSKLYRYGIRGGALEWFRSYLQNRKQYVDLDGTNSDVRSISHGVPQGSILAPLLFLLFINDLPYCSDFFKFTLFADDSNLLCKLGKNSNIQEVINKNLIIVNNWLIANKIKINVEKSKFMVFSYKNSVNVDCFRFGTGVITSTSTIKFLGVLIDKKLNFKDHVSKLKNIISTKVGLLYRLNKILPHEILKFIYNSIVVPHLNYGIVLWYSAPSYVIQKLFIAQKKCVRAICNLSFNETTEPHFRKLKLLKLCDVYRKNLLVHFHDTVYSNLNSNLKSIMKPH